MNNIGIPNFLSGLATQNSRGTRKKIFIIILSLYFVFIIITQVPFIAENYSDNKMLDSYEANLTFPSDGKSGHYYVERYNTDKPGTIHVQYTTKSNSLEVDCNNIKVLKIYCREMYEDKSEEVFNRDPGLDSNYYKTYFIERNNFYVHVYTSDKIETLAFFDTPNPYNVTVNGQEWWLAGVNYTYKNDGIIFSHVPTGHNYVDVYFRSMDKNSPKANIIVNKKIIGIGETVIFNGSASSDPDGKIISYVWDFSTGVYKGGEQTQYKFTKKGNYNVILTVTDEDYLLDRASVKIIVLDRIMNISASVDKPIITPGGLLNHTFTLNLNSTWIHGVKDVLVECQLPNELNFLSAAPLPQLFNNTIIWHLGIYFETSELPTINLQTIVNDQVENNSLISVSADLNYNDISGNKFPQQTSNTVTTLINFASIQAPRIRSRINDIILPEDSKPYRLFLSQYEYDFSDSGTDLNWYITNKNDSLYLISGEFSNNDTITIIPKPDMFGSSLVTLWLQDSDGFSVNQKLWINITPVNDPPILSNTPDLILHSNEPYTFDYEPYIYDIDTPADQLEILVYENTALDHTEGIEKGEDGLENHHSIEDFKITYNFPNQYVDTQVYISLVLYDGQASDEDTIQIDITDDYTPKLTKDLPDIWLFEGETKKDVFDIDDYFEDPDQDSLYYSIGETHIKVNIKNDHSVDISAPSDWNGVDTVTIRARDPMGAIAEDTFLVTVSPLNDPPKFEGVPETFIVHYEVDYSFDLSPYIFDEDNDISELSLVLDDIHIQTDPNNRLKIIMNFPQNMIDMEVPVLLVVTDGIDTDEEMVTIKITDNWPPEILYHLSDISIYEDEYIENAFNLNNYFSDKDSDTLFFTYGHENIHIYIDDDGSVDISAAPNWNGEERVTFRATDSTKAFVESIIRITVHPVNDPPTILKIPEQYGITNTLWRVDLSDYISDIDNDISELTIEAESLKFDINVKGRELLIYSNVPITENITITVSDGSSYVIEHMNIEITDKDKAESSGGTSQTTITFILLIIISIISITGFTGYRVYKGNYKIEEIFCISNTGLLISHINDTKVNHRADEDIVSGMLTAIINFAQEAFTEEEKNKKAWGIKEIQMNEKNILIDRGEYSYLATVFSGRSGKKLYINSRNTLNKLEKQYSQKLKKWNGNINDLAGIKHNLFVFLKS